MSSSKFGFKLIKLDGKARQGIMQTRHGAVLTPAFMPVATQGSVKSLSPTELTEVGAHIILSNAYHLYLRPGIDLIEDIGGLHNFMNWKGPILTDSGGYQVFSLGSLIDLNDEGVTFRSHIDGTRHLFTPENSISYQERLGVDIAMCLDQLVASNKGKELVKNAMQRTHKWAERCKTAHSSSQQALFGIVQGGVSKTLREQSAQFITNLEFDGYAIGGLAVGETKSDMYKIIDYMDNLLPRTTPRYLMGVGSPEDIVHSVMRGVDLFDCVLPTRVARNGALFTQTGRVDIMAPKYKRWFKPLEEDCVCYTCQNFTVAYIHHLFKSRELLAPRLATIHNLKFIMGLMKNIRSHIAEGTFQSYSQDFLGKYTPTNETSRLFHKNRLSPI
ncbi:tRNA guanosine(34) transglycosylase Tgt [SAR202 cluster bacterium AC-409-J13_OGT_754m]|nr:tRNA guanosine(34) transglycosylase Tgt [SAR202 cluster bacterium AC-409-J13_OGT_754m]